MSSRHLSAWGAVFFVAGLLLAVVVRLPALVGPDPPPPLVAANQDPHVPGDWVVIYPDGLVLAVAAPHERYPHIGAPTLDVTALHYGDEPVAVSFAQFSAPAGDGYRSFSDGDPSFGTRQLPPRGAHQGRVVLYGSQDLAELIIARDGQRVSLDLGGDDYGAVASVTKTLFHEFNR